VDYTTIKLFGTRFTCFDVDMKYTIFITFRELLHIQVDDLKFNLSLIVKIGLVKSLGRRW